MEPTTNDVSPGDHRRVYRSRDTLQAAVGATVATIVCVVLALVGGKFEIAGYICTPLFALMAWRMWTVGVHVEVDGVKVVGVGSSRRLQWDDVDHFDVRPWGNYPYAAYAVRTDGEAIAIPAISAPGRPKSRLETFRLQVQTPVDQLNQALADWKKAPRS